MSDSTEKQKIRAGVLICGAYGMGNAGDEAILEAIVAEMRSIDAAMPITVMTRDPEGTAKRLGVNALHTLDFPGFCRAAGRAKLYINGGGSLIQDVTSRRSLWYYLLTLRAAKKRGCRVLMYGCGIGPVNYAGDVRLTARILNRYVDAITLREPDSLAELERYGVTKPELILASDPALSLRAAPAQDAQKLLNEHGGRDDGRYICFALRRWPGFNDKAADFAAAARHAWEKHGLTPLFLSINHKNDGDASNAVIALLGDTPHLSIPGPLPTPLTLAVMARSETAVCMRLHGLIFAAGQGVALVGVSYDPKVDAFLRYIGCGECAALPELTADSLCALVDRAVGLAGDRSALEENVRRLRDIESRNTQTARALLEKENKND